MHHLSKKSYSTNFEVMRFKKFKPPLSRLQPLSLQVLSGTLLEVSKAVSSSVTFSFVIQPWHAFNFSNSPDSPFKQFLCSQRSVSVWSLFHWHTYMQYSISSCFHLSTVVPSPPLFAFTLFLGVLKGVFEIWSMTLFYLLGGTSVPSGCILPNPHPLPHPQDWAEGALQKW